jgi:RNA polymerase sigma-70 factor (ECF subfamily)
MAPDPKRPKLISLSGNGGPRLGPIDDAQLLAAVRAGNREVAARFHHRVRPVVERSLRRLLRGIDSEHDDLMQMVLIELVRAIDRFRGECSLDRWVTTLTAHVVYKQLRRRKAERRFFVVTDESFDPTQVPQPSHAGDRLQARSALQRVMGHLNALNPDRATAFLLHDVHGYELKEMAVITQVSVAAAQSRLVRGRADLQALLAADPELMQGLREGSKGEGDE